MDGGCVLSEDAPTISSGECPRCSRSVFWAFDCSERRVLLEPLSGVAVVAPRGSTVVVASVAGRLSLASPWVFCMHVCSSSFATSSVGCYTEDVLSCSCPVDSCTSPPGEMCLSSRHEILPRPHGARVAFSSGLSWDDNSVDHSTVLTNLPDTETSV